MVSQCKRPWYLELNNRHPNIFLVYQYFLHRIFWKIIWNSHYYMWFIIYLNSYKFSLQLISNELCSHTIFSWYNDVRWNQWTITFPWKFSIIVCFKYANLKCINFIIIMVLNNLWSLKYFRVHWIFSFDDREILYFNSPNFSYSSIHNILIVFE